MILCIKIREVIWQTRTLLLFKLSEKKTYSLFSIFMLLCCIVLKKGQKSLNLSVSTLTTYSKHVQRHKIQSKGKVS